MRGLAGEEAGPTSTRARQVLLMEEGEAGLGVGGGQGRVPSPSKSERASQHVSKILDGRGSSLKKTNRTQHKAINDFGYHSIEFDKVRGRRRSSVMCLNTGAQLAALEEQMDSRLEDLTTTQKLLKEREMELEVWITRCRRSLCEKETEMEHKLRHIVAFKREQREKIKMCDSALRATLVFKW